jgi:hypothetical protein
MVKLKLVQILLIGLAPLVLMGYGWYLGQLHQSGYDIAGILLFFTGAVGFALAFLIHRFTRKFPWHNKWFANILTGVVSCAVVFALVLVYARLHG